MVSSTTAADENPPNARRALARAAGTLGPSIAQPPLAAYVAIQVLLATIPLGGTGLVATGISMRGRAGSTLLKWGSLAGNGVVLAIGVLKVLGRGATGRDDEIHPRQPRARLLGRRRATDHRAAHRVSRSGQPIERTDARFEGVLGYHFRDSLGGILFDIERVDFAELVACHADLFQAGAPYGWPFQSCPDDPVSFVESAGASAFQIDGSVGFDGFVVCKSMKLEAADVSEAADAPE